MLSHKIITLLKQIQKNKITKNNQNILNIFIYPKNIKMNQLKQIIIQRIKKIIQLQHILDSEDIVQAHNKYQLVLQHKRSERYRSMRQNQIYTTLKNNIQFEKYDVQEKVRNQLLGQFFMHSVDICSIYDQVFQKFRNMQGLQAVQEKVVKLYMQFFAYNGFKQKSQYINLLLKKDKNLIYDYTLFMGWLSQWSKKTYCQLLQKQIKRSFAQNNNFTPTGITNSFTLALFSNKRKSTKQIFQNTSNVFAELSDVSLANRFNISSYFIDQLQSYYKLTGIDEVDYFYLKTIKRRLGKLDLLKPSNLSKAANNIIQTTANRDIAKIVKNYQLQYFNKLAKNIKKQVTLKPIQNNLKRTVLLSNIKKKSRNITQTDQSAFVNRSKLLSPKMSQIQFICPQDIHTRQKKVKVFAYNKSIHKNLQLSGTLGKKDYLINQIKSALQIAIVNQINQPTNLIKKRREQPLSIKLKQKDFLKCEGIFLNRSTKIQQQLRSKINTSQLSFEKKVKKQKLSISPKDIQFYPQPTKLAKIFQISDLRINKNKQILTRVIQQLAQ